MKVTFEMEFCKGACIHAVDTIVFDENGSRDACNHPDLIKPRHCEGTHRLLPKHEIPKWCPLQHGGKYQ